MSENTLYKKIYAFLNRQGIEYVSALPFSLCDVINEKKLYGFEPKSAVVFLIPYLTGLYPNRNVSLYSVSRDYHLFARLLSEDLAEEMSQAGFTFKLFCDSSPVNERSLALKAGLGVMGENRLLINEKYGSYVFIACILTDAVFEEDEYTAVSQEKHCIGCQSCKRACGFLKGERDVCISELNQRKNVSEDELKLILSQKIRWGCDTCQTVCPMNKNAAETPIEFFYRDVIDVLTQEALRQMPKDCFESRAYSWRGKNVILRNLQ